MRYDLVNTTLNLKKYQVERMILSPERWSTYISHTHLDWHNVKFNKINRKSIPGDQGGVYTFIVKPDIANHPSCSYLLYVGKTQRQTLRKRFMQYFTERDSNKGRPRIQKMLTLWHDHIWFCYATIEDRTIIHLVEEALIGAYMPPMNDEFPADIRPAIGAW